MSKGQDDDDDEEEETKMITKTDEDADEVNDNY